MSVLSNVTTYPALHFEFLLAEGETRRPFFSESLRVQIGPGARAPAIAVRRDLFEAGLNEAAVESGSASMGVRWLRRSDIDGWGE